MFKRLVYLGLVSTVFSAGSGCCLVTALHDCWLEKYQCSHYPNCGCGERWINAWYNAPPDCCDPCDSCGHYTGRKWWTPCQQGCGYGGFANYSGGVYNGSSNGGDVFDDGGSYAPSGTPTPAEEIPAPQGQPTPAVRPQPQTAPRSNQRMGRRPRVYEPTPNRMLSRRPQPQRPVQYEPDDAPADETGPQLIPPGRRSTASYRRQM